MKKILFIINKFATTIRGIFIVAFATTNIKIFRKIKTLVSAFFFEDYKSLLFGIFIIISLLYKYFDILKVKDYYINMRVKEVKDNGTIVIKRDYYEDTIKIQNLRLPSAFDKCSADFKSYFLIKMNEYIKSNNNFIDIKIIKKNLLTKSGYFFIKNQNIQDYIDNNIFLRQEIPIEKQQDWCFILKQAKFIKPSKTTQITEGLRKIKSFLDKIHIQPSKYF